jgi:hypothetical protein
MFWRVLVDQHQLGQECDMWQLYLLAAHGCFQQLVMYSMKSAQSTALSRFFATTLLG